MATKISGNKRKFEEIDHEEKETDNDGDSDYSPKEDQQRKRRKTNPKSNKSKKSKKKQTKKKSARGLTKKAANEFKKKMNEYVKSLARMVNLDWHDGYFEQGEELQEYFQYLHEPSKCIYKCIIKQNEKDFDKLNEILKNMSDSWDNIHAIPFRGGVELGDTDFDFIFTEINITKNFYASPNDLISFMWSAMLYAACFNKNVTDDQIYRYIKDANDNDVDILNGCKNDDDDDGDANNDIIDQHECLKGGINRLKELFAKKSIWNQLSTTKKTHKMRRAIDRRYDGALHLRTRDYHLYDNDYW